MGSIVLFLAVVGIIAGWWLARQRLTAKPWLEEGPLAEFPGAGAMAFPAQTVGLGIFLVVVGALFALVISAYSVRMLMLDWRPLPVPDLLWFNTGLLVASSVALQVAYASAKRLRPEDMKLGVLAAASFAVLFLVGQVLAWLQLQKAGYFLASNPANAFFYLLAALHGLHLSGGLVALGRVGRKIWLGNERRERVRMLVGLCAAYWHFLLFIWLVVMALLMGWADDFIELCGRLFT
ncbi:cytochrome c oxidase subunit 3 [Dongia deserti]|uniref:cytochrome c oxidase subunit 3 n=1 Tax=Dongia deserti TaxID=2268030 RepID=UPI000E6504E6|nr:cytochrome c oxidase subunit 3 [Dongia deserti]